jgi:hypothetical protein
MWPLDTGKGKETDSPLSLQKEHHPAKDWNLAFISDF